MRKLPGEALDILLGVVAADTVEARQAVTPGNEVHRWRRRLVHQISTRVKNSHCACEVHLDICQICPAIRVSDFTAEAREFVKDVKSWLAH